MINHDAQTKYTTSKIRIEIPFTEKWIGLALAHCDVALGWNVVENIRFECLQWFQMVHSQYISRYLGMRETVFQAVFIVFSRF